MRAAVSAKFPLPVTRPEDLSDAKAAFAVFLESQKTDDPRVFDLIAQDCVATILLTDGKEMRIAAFSPEAFRKEITRQLALKEGNHDVYEDVNYAQEGKSVRVISNVLYAASGKRGPSSVLFVRDQGAFKIKELRAEVPVTAFPPG